MKFGLNALFAPPPSVELLSGDWLSRIEVDSSGLAHGETPGLHYGCHDVADCFLKMRLSGEIRHLFYCPGVSNKYLKMTGNQSFAQPNSLADVLFVVDGFFLELHPVRKPSTTGSPATLATWC